MPSPTRVLARNARFQHGLVTFDQALDAGLSPSGIKRWTQSGRFEPLYLGVYRLAGAPRSWEQDMLAAVFAGGPGAVASHRAAARIWELVDHAPVEITIDQERKVAVPGAIVHRRTGHDGRFTTTRRRIPTVNPMLALAQLGAVSALAEVEDCLDKALANRLLSIRAVENVLDQVCGRGRRGSGVLRRVLDERALGADRPDGLLEPRMARLLREHGLPPAAFQHSVKCGRKKYRIDFAYPEVMFAIEVKGYEKHSSPRAVEADYEREQVLIAAGWTVISFSWRQVVRRPAWVASQLRSILRRLESEYRTSAS